MMVSTLVWTKGHYGDARFQNIKITDTVWNTVRAIGRGQITVAHVLWAVNSQLPKADAAHALTEQQVRRALSQIARERADFTSNGHGVYRWL